MTPETLMTDDATSPEGASASAPDAAQPPTGSGDGDQQQAAERQGAQDGRKTEDQQGAPDAYAFQAPEGLQLDDAVARAFADVAKELNLPQDKAQAVIDKMAPAMAARHHEQLQAAGLAWAEAAKADPEYGGAALDENLGLAKKALDTFGTPELKALLTTSRLGSHPEVVRLFVRAGKALSEDTFVAGKGGNTNAHDARRLYAASGMNP